MAEGIVSTSFAAFFLSGRVKYNVGLLNTLPFSSQLQEELRLSPAFFF
jgi:hypothetical protein